uniref:SGNH domain-containing protein n=1 Tax=Panagrolaimus sp. ES5 TaxID=591445 RepID=A0AC34FWK5_9BILA
MFLCININVQISEYEEETAKVDPLHGNQEAFDSCKRVYYSNCTSSPLIDKFMTARPGAHAFDMYCSYKLNPNATKTILITGNSFVYFQIRGILDAIKQSKTEFSEAFVVAHPGCSIIAGDLNPVVTDCELMKGSHDKLLEILRPDIIIHSSRVSQFVELGNQSLVHDRYYDEFEKSILNLANYTDRLILIEPHPHLGTYNYTNPLMVAHSIQNNQSLSQFRLPITEFHRIHDSSWNRVKEVSKICLNCIIIPTQHYYCEKEYCSIIDPKTKVARFCDEAHITPKQSLKYVLDLIKAIDDVYND